MTVEYRVLGPLEVVRDGQAVDVGSPKQRALLLSLLLRPNRTVRTERLFDELWPDGPPKGARASLHSYVSRLRSALGDADATVLRTRSGGYELAVASDATDAGRFERATADGRQALAGGDPATARTAFEAAFALWRGDAFADVADQPFAQAEAVRLEELRLSAHEDAVEALLALGRHADAVAELAPLVDHHPLRERLQRQLAVALYRCDRHTEALDHLRAYRERLADELGVDPGPDLQRLAEAILRHDPALRPGPAPGEAPAVAAARPRSAVVATADEAPRPLVGRTGELAVIDAALAEHADGRGGVLLLGGDAGIGKTRLLEELADRAGRAGALVAWGRSHEGGGAPAFWPWTQVVRALWDGLDPDERAALEDDDLLRLAQLAPEVGRGASTSGEPAGDLANERFALLVAVDRLLARATAARPTVLLLEDLHWADEPSLELLVSVARSAGDRPLLVAASYRDVPAERSPGLDAALASIARTPAVRHLTPSPLTRDDVARLVGDIVGDDRAAAVAGIVHDRTDGNPFFVSEFGRLLAAEGVHPATAAAVPTGVHHVVQRRYRSLPEATQRLLGVAAVAGRTFDLRLVADALEAAVDDVLDDVGPALEHRLVEADRDAPARLRFVHALVRETVLDDLPGLRVAQLHRAVGHAMTRDPVASQAVDEVAEHFWHAAVLGEHAPAVRYALAAADANQQRAAYEQAERHLRRALELTGRSEADRLLRIDVLTRLAELLARSHGYSAPGLAELVAAAPPDPTDAPVEPSLVRLWQFLWSCHHSGGRWDEAIAVAGRMLAAARTHGDDPVLSALGSFCAGASLLHRGQLAEALASFEAARACFTGDLARFDITMSHLVVDVPMFEGVARALAGDRDGARRCSADAIERARGLDRPFSSAVADVFGAWTDAVLDDPVSARDRAAAAAELASAHRFHQLHQVAEVLLGWAEARLGEPARAVERMTAALAALQRASSRGGEVFWRVLLADALDRAGDTAAADAARRRAGAVADEIGERAFDRWLGTADGAHASGADGRQAGPVEVG